jgi:hypothetical protein
MELWRKGLGRSKETKLQNVDTKLQSRDQTTKSGPNYKYAYLENGLMDFDGVWPKGIGKSKETKLQSRGTKLQSRDQTTNMCISRMG